MGQPEPITVILTSIGSEQQAVEMSEELVGRRLATCINIVPCLRSIYRWKGRVCEDTELLLLIKTPSNLFDDVAQAIRELHPYELPEILAIPVEKAEEVFHRWIIDMASGGSGPFED